MHVDPFPALRYCQTAWSPQRVALGHSHMRCYSLLTMCELVRVCILHACVHMFGIFVCNLIFLLFVYKASMCANNTSAVCVLWGPGIISHITKSCLVYNLLYFISLRSHVICSCQPTYLLITSCVFCPLCSHWLKGAEVGLPGQYKEGGSLHQSLV